MKITIEDTDGVFSVQSDGIVETDKALSSLMMATCETLCKALGDGFTQKVIDEIFKEFGKTMTEAASMRYKQLYDIKDDTGLSDKEKDFLLELFKS